MSWWDRQLKTFFKGGVNVDTPADGDLLQYDSATGEWSNFSEAYSTSETDTGKKWIDGKIIYRKVINFGSLTNTSEKSVAHNITGITQVISLTAIATNSGTNYRPLNYVRGGTTAIDALRSDATNVIINSTVDYSAYTAYVIMEYTK